ncbi:hypothetical protein NDI45_26925 [Leptolyngbya sp. GB1-A1]|uniref:hypothetical protein n=1 Tax=Leptolyngbya sp. GB1-A1 TaxID=2933908 RepID=UPI0032994758
MLDAPLTGSEADGFEIARTIVGYANKINSTEKIGLHYTGGTKTMAAHAYRAFLSLNRSPKPVFSYLDSRTLRICIDDLENQQTRMFPAVLDKPPSLETILALHNLEWKKGKEPQRQPIAKDAAIAFAEIHGKSGMGEIWRKWCQQELGKKLKKGGENSLWKPEKDLESHRQLNLQFPPVAVPDNMIQVLRNCLDSSVVPQDNVGLVE